MKLYYINTANFPQIIILLHVIDKCGKEAAVGGTIQLYKIFKGTQSSIIPILVLTVALLYACIQL